MSAQATTNFQDWLDQIDFSDYNTVYELYNAIETLQSCGSFEVEPARGSDERWIVTSVDSDQPLLVSGQKARQALLDKIENDYCEGMGIEGYYSYHKAMEKDD